MAFFDKLSELATAATEKASSAIESSKLSAKISTEEKKIGEYTRKIGELFVGKMDSGEQFDPEVMQQYAVIIDSREVIATVKAEIEAAKVVAATPAPTPTPAPSSAMQGVPCPICSASNQPNVKFCCSCGAKMQVLSEAVRRICSSCGTEVAKGIRFCSECGNKMD